MNAPSLLTPLIVGIDHLMCVGRAVTNYIGNAVAAVAIGRTEGELSAEQDRENLQAGQASRSSWRIGNPSSRELKLYSDWESPNESQRSQNLITSSGEFSAKTRVSMSVGNKNHSR